MLNHLIKAGKRLRPSLSLSSAHLLRHISEASTKTLDHDRCIKQNLLELESKGFTVVEDIFTTEEISKLQEDYLKIKEKAFYIIDNISPLPRTWEENGKLTHSQYLDNRQRTYTASRCW